MTNTTHTKIRLFLWTVIAIDLGVMLYAMGVKI
jgi:hypothetical protein